MFAVADAGVTTVGDHISEGVVDGQFKKNVWISLREAVSYWGEQRYFPRETAHLMQLLKEIDAWHRPARNAPHQGDMTAGL